MTRLDELRENLADIERRIAGACAEVGRTRDELSLIVVTKTYPASDVALLGRLGVSDVGENRHPEAADKLAELRDASGTEGSVPRLHFVGHLQTNKAGAVAGYADVVHSVDRPKLARSLSRGAQAAGREVGCLVQVDVDRSDPGRSGAAIDTVPELADLIAELPGLRFDGLMTVAPLGAPARPAFDEVVELSQRLLAVHPDASIVSAGMSGDFEDAIAAGATHLRLGRAILGERPRLR